MTFNVFSLKDSYGAGVADKQRQQINQQSQQINQQAIQGNAMNQRYVEEDRAAQQQANQQAQQRQGLEFLHNASQQMVELWQTNPEQAQRVQPQILQELQKQGIIQDANIQLDDPQEWADVFAVTSAQIGPQQKEQAQRKYEKAADGRYRYVDGGELVFPDAQPASPDAPQEPSDVYTAKWYSNASPEEKAAFDQTKRGPQQASSALEKRLYEVNDRGYKAEQNVARYNNLAEQMVAVNPESGLPAKWTEAIKAATGQEDAVTLLRKEWNNLRVSAAVQNLPPGVASDKDIELVMSAFLPEFAEANTVASFMRGLSKIEQLNADYADFESMYLSENLSPVGMKEAWKAHAKERYAPQIQPQNVIRFDAQGNPIE